MVKYCKKCHHFYCGGECRKFNCILDPNENGQGKECEVYASSEDEAAKNFVRQIGTDHNYSGKDVTVIVIDGDRSTKFRFQ